MNESLEIPWPDRYNPANCPIHVHNHLDMKASPENVWAWLTCATLWPSWYVNSANVEIMDGTGPFLQKGMRFRWKTFGVTIVSTVDDYVENERIAWSAKALGLDVYHAWVLSPSAAGCLVVTEETQHGVLSRLAKLLMPNRMFKFHQIWLESLEQQALTGKPIP